VLRNQDPKCPCCETRVSSLSAPSQILKTLLENTRWKCPHRTRGCAFTGLQTELIEHLEAGCGEALITCRVPKCGKSLKRKDLQKHLRDPQNAAKHQKLEREEVNKLNSSGLEDSVVQMIRFPCFKERAATCVKGQSLESDEFSFQGHRFYVGLYPEGHADSSEGNAGVLLFKDSDFKKNLTVSMRLAGGSEKTSACFVQDYGELIPGGGEGPEDFVRISELHSVAARRGNMVDIQVRLSACSSPVEDRIFGGGLENEEDVTRLSLRFPDFEAFVGVSSSSGTHIDTQRFFFQGCPFFFRLHPEGRVPGYSSLFMMKCSPDAEQVAHVLVSVIGGKCPMERFEVLRFDQTALRQEVGWERFAKLEDLLDASREGQSHPALELRVRVRAPHRHIPLAIHQGAEAGLQAQVFPQSLPRQQEAKRDGAVVKEEDWLF